MFDGKQEYKDGANYLPTEEDTAKR